MLHLFFSTGFGPQLGQRICVQLADMGLEMFLPREALLTQLTLERLHAAVGHNVEL